MFGVSPHRYLLDGISSAMAGSLAFHIVIEVDMSAVERLREQARAGGRRITITAVVVQAIARAIAEKRVRYPLLNALDLRWPFRRITVEKDIAMAVIVAREVGGEDHFLAPIIVSPERRTVGEISETLQSWTTCDPAAEPSFAGMLKLQRLPRLIQKLVFLLSSNVRSLARRYNGTVALTTVGRFGPDIQVPPTLGMSFAFGVVRPRAVVVDGQVTVRPTMYLSGVFDRRRFNGAPGAELLARIKAILEEGLVDRAVQA